MSIKLIPKLIKVVFTPTSIKIKSMNKIMQKQMILTSQYTLTTQVGVSLRSIRIVITCKVRSE